MRNSAYLVLLVGLMFTVCFPVAAVADHDVPVELLRAAANVTPTPQQLAYQRMEQNMFVHFGMSTFVDKTGNHYLGWGDGTESPDLFNPTALDCNQWASVAKNAGMEMMVLTAKHHDGFGLWPSAYTDYDVASSSWRGGQGDVVREAADAAAAAGLKFGIYLSPWDRHEATYGTPAYNTFYQNQLTELLTNYGPIAEVWFDGASDGSLNTWFDWDGIGNLARTLQPNVMVFSANPLGQSGDSDMGLPTSESGYARSSQWSVIADTTPPTPIPTRWDNDAGHRDRLVDATRVDWYAGETFFTVRPNWFHRSNEDDQVMTPQQLEDIYYHSVGQNVVSLVGLPPDRRGLIHENDVAAVNAVYESISATFRVNLTNGKTAAANSVGGAHTADLAFDDDLDTYWTPAAGTVPTHGANAVTLEIDLGEMTTFDRISLQEMISEGQRVEDFELEAWNGSAWTPLSIADYYKTTIGHKGLERFPEVTASKVRLTILDSRDVPMISEFGVYYSLTPVPEPTPESTAAFNQEDPGSTLAGYVSNTWDVNTGSKGWLSAELRVQLSGGDIYQDPNGTNVPPNPGDFTAHPTLEYDSYMTGGTDSESPSTTGPAPLVLGGAVDFGGGVGSTFDTSEIDATWASSLATNPAGELMLARVTLSDDAQGIYSYRIGVENNAPISLVGGFIVDGVMTDPVLTSIFTQEDPGSTLEGYVSNTWDVNTLGDNWLSAELLVELTGGDIYQDTAGSDTPPDPGDFTATPTLEFDSYMTGGTDSELPSTIGPLPLVLGGAVDLGGTIPVTFDTSTISATWASSLATNPEGELMLGRFTLSDDAQGTFKFRIGLDDSGAIFYLEGVIVDGAMLLMAPTSSVPGDADGDGDVDAADASILAGNWQQTIEGGYSVGDFDEDGDVDDADATILATNWGVGVAAASVPEPSTATLLLILGALGLAMRRRRAHAFV